MLGKNFNIKEVESELYPEWEKSGAFTPKLDGRKPIYTPMMPPPNVTGSLHMGHALNHTLQDIIVRYKRMQGYDVLWQPGTDHAGIATQSVVERQMDEEGVSRHDLGREKFLERVWDWKDHSGGTIVHQLRRLGISPDWTRERFTMDEGLSKAVVKVFVELYEKGLIFRAKRLVNWDPKLLTAISDLEVTNKETKGHMWRIKYPLAEGGHIVVATTRPETMLGDTGIAVHPEDPRYKHLIGKEAVLPIVGRHIPIVADEYSDPEKGTGAVKITPAHDFNDFEVGKRHNLPAVEIFDLHARINENAPQEFLGLDRFEARKRILERLQADNLIEGVDEIEHSLPVSSRTDVIVEPMLTDQWFVDAQTLAQPALAVLDNEKLSFIPKNWEKTYRQWLDNIQPWCISRQLWWGHRIPAWFGPDGKIFVAYDEEQARANANKFYGQVVKLNRDEDVLDTWFSSALWPFSTLGWPDQTNELERCYPGDLLITGHDIIFFWVARMVMMGMEFMKDVPFHKVFITALVLDEKGQKMSKSKGNIIDPLEFLDVYGADAVRFSLAALAGPGRSVNFSQSQVEGYRNFVTKLWNAARFCEHHQCAVDQEFDPSKCRLAVNRWVVAEIHHLGQYLATQLENMRYDDACAALYHFIWGQFCDWYLELSKPIFFGDNEEEKSETRKVAAWALSQIVHLLHPFMPFVTEELWKKLFHQDLLISESWPEYACLDSSAAFSDVQAQDAIKWLIQFISDIRALRAELNVPASSQLSISYGGENQKAKERLDCFGDTIKKMARLSEVTLGQKPTEGAAEVFLEGEIFYLNVGDAIDLGEEAQRLSSQLKDLEKEIMQLDRKLSQPDFIQKAPPEVIKKNQNRLSEAQLRKDKLEKTLLRLRKSA